MPHIPTDLDRQSWKYGITVIGKVAKPGCKPVIQGNGRVSLRFTMRIPCGVPFGTFPDKKLFADFNIRCIWFDPDFLVNTSDVVEATGTLTRIGDDLGLLVNRAQIIATFVSKNKKI